LIGRGRQAALLLLAAWGGIGACTPGPGTQGPAALTSASASSGAPEFPPLAEGALSGPRLAEIDLSAGAPELRSGGLFGEDRGTFYDLTSALQKLQEEATPGVFVRLGATRVGWGRSAEVVRGLKKLRERGKRVFCHGDELGNSSYGLAAEACEQIWMSPAGSVDTVGLGAELIFARDLLARFGIEADIFQVGRYKGTGETLTRSNASEEVKASLQGALGGIRERWLQGIDTGRPGGMARAAVERGPYAAQEARQIGLIDQVGYAAEALAALRNATGGGRTELAFGPRTTAGRGSEGLLALARGISGARRTGGTGKGQVAVLRTSGAITLEPSRSAFGGSDGIAARTVMKQLRGLAEDRSVHAVVLRIDSPGGSALASDLLWFDLMRLREQKPLIVSVGDMAASGGYYMACAGTKILAEEASIVGSIGVVGGKVALGGALARFGINVEVVPADPAGDPRRVAYSSGLVPWDEGSRERARTSMQSVYNLFLQRVSRGRGKSIEEVAAFAEGRIFSGREGLARGMIDQIGGLQDAIDLARREAGLDPESSVQLVDPDGSFLDSLLSGDSEEARSLAARPPLALLNGWLPWAEQVAAHGASLAPLLRGEQALTTVPFALLVR
jgi:protease-4